MPIKIAQLRNSGLAAAKDPVAATGPYRVREFVPGKSLTLVRNPYFHQWSASAQPQGYPSVIRWRLTPSLPVAIADVRAGRADITDLFGFHADAFRRLAVRFPSQAHEQVRPFTHMVLLNARTPPFDDVRARRAVAFALDRTALANYFGSTITTCQLAPPDYPGYAPYCPYTTNPDRSGKWHGPDRARARRLTAESGTSHARVDVYTNDVEPFRSAFAEIVRQLRRIGYRARLHAVTGEVYGSTLGRRRGWNVAGWQWLPDYPTASFFYDSLLACRTGFLATWVHDCDPRLDVTAHRAKRLEATEPAVAQRVWRRLYRAVVDDALIIPEHINSEQKFVSARVGNYQSGALWGPVYDQMWVR